MASIFTFDPDPPRVSSPWATSNASTPRISADPETSLPPPGQTPKICAQSPQPSLLADCGITKLEAEPQEGGTEYKLHLLLRPRRSFTSSSTGIHIVGSQHSKQPSISPPEAVQDSSVSESYSTSTTHSNQSRQHRLQQLTTQLLWRLQQSSPYHSYSTNNVVLPNLAETNPLSSSTLRPGRLLPGIEESRGAYYEIGVSDDGTLVGLTRDEMDESLGTLRIMAASLGCCVEVLRMVIVGECEWTEELPGLGGELKPEDSQGEASESPLATTTAQKLAPTPVKHIEKLWVAEAIVKPDLKPSVRDTCEPEKSVTAPTGNPLVKPPSQVGDIELSQEDIRSPTEQLRVSLTGATTSGKSSLLGTLTTGTLDNGRGKSRLSLLKHRHELASGVTSSVAQELVGYKTSQDKGKGRNVQTNIEVINYASGNVSSWTDIHASSENGRLVLLSDCAGHPRYRRTTVRGLVGWAPHWVALCVAADEGDDSIGRNSVLSPARDAPGIAGVGLDLMEAHLDLCLKLGLPLVVIVTKLDLASKTGLRNTLAKVLSTLKAAGRKPIILPGGGSQTDGDVDTNLVSNKDTSDVEKAVAAIRGDQSGAIVPIVLTSAVKGIGIGKVHALLYGLPVPEISAQTAPQRLTGKMPQVQHRPSKLFHIEEIFVFPKTQTLVAKEKAQNEEDTSLVLSGHLRYGQVSLGEELILGPCESRLSSEGSYPLDSQQAAGTNPSPFCDVIGSVASDPSGGARPSAADPTKPLSHRQADSAEFEAEWASVKVVSIRNLRLPVRRLLAGQTGTISIVFLSTTEGLSLDRNIPRPAECRGTDQQSLTINLASALDRGKSFLTPEGSAVRIPPGKGDDRHRASLFSSSPRVSFAASKFKIRKGMVLLGYGHEDENTKEAPVSYGGFVARFSEIEPVSVTAGALVVVFIASVRASARVVYLHSRLPSHPTPDADAGDVFGFDDDNGDEASTDRTSVTEVLFHFASSREWVELGREVLVMPGGGPGLYGNSERGEKGVGGLEGFVGRIVDVVE
ncbi:hypothetical protein FGG08_002723 [Glutinoglossum americanum]|uniref:Tr-type G domain-containing protein n=1 Tax=Glutinoglossum americanum TaxID=1670608 RepID=A0A9P8I5T7_9PEZI|nr:hypothetical protein FGG08_002723 [Glutinoglossum americanum]